MKINLVKPGSGSGAGSGSGTASHSLSRSRAFFAIAFAIALSVAVQKAGAQTPPASQEGFRLQPGDVVRLTIWREEDMSGELPVGADGMVVFPQIGPVPVTGESTTTLRAKLLEEYSKTLRNPSVDIQFLKRIAVFGAVNKADLLLVDETMTIADLIALAGGTTPEGASDRIEILRDGERLQWSLSQGTRLRELAIMSGDQVYVPERRFISRNPGIIAAILSGVISVAVAIIATR